MHLQFIDRYRLMSLVCEMVAHEGSIFDDGESMMDDVNNFEDAKGLIAKDGVVDMIENRVRAWIKKLKDFILESKQIRRENDNSGPQQELEYWKRRGAQFSQLARRLQVIQYQQRNNHIFIYFRIVNFFFIESRSSYVIAVLTSITIKIDKRLGRC